MAVQSYSTNERTARTRIRDQKPSTNTLFRQKIRLKVELEDSLFAILSAPEINRKYPFLINYGCRLSLYENTIRDAIGKDFVRLRAKNQTARFEVERIVRIQHVHSYNYVRHFYKSN